MGSLEETYPRLVPQIAEARKAGYGDEEIQGHLQGKMQKAFKAGYSVDEVNAYLGEIPKPSIMEPIKGIAKDVGRMAVSVAPALVGGAAGALLPVPGGTYMGAMGGAALGETLAQYFFDDKMSPKQIALQAALGVIPGIKAGSVTSTGGRMALRAGEGAAMGGAATAGSNALEGNEFSWVDTAKGALMGALMGSVVGKWEGGRTKPGDPPLTKEQQARARAIEAEMQRLERLRQSPKGRELLQKELAEMEAAGPTRAERQADAMAAEWAQEVTGKPGAKNVTDPYSVRSEQPEVSQFNRFIDVEPSVGRMADASAPAPPPRPEQVDVLGQIRAAGPAAPDVQRPPQPAGIPADGLPPRGFPEDITPLVGQTDPISVAMREAAQTEHVQAQLMAARERSDAMADRFILANRPHSPKASDAADITRTTPRGEGEPALWRQGPGEGGSRGRMVPREEAPGGTVTDRYERLGLPAPDQPAPPPLPGGETIQQRIARLDAENAKLRAGIGQQQPTPQSPAPMRARVSAAEAQRRDAADWLVSQGEILKRQKEIEARAAAEKSKAARVQAKLRVEDLDANQREIARDAEMILRDPRSSEFSREAAAEKLRELGIEPETRVANAQTQPPPVETPAPKVVEAPAPVGQAPEVFTSPKEPPEVSRATVAELQRGLKEEAPVGVPPGQLTPEQIDLQARAAPVSNATQQARLDSLNSMAVSDPANAIARATKAGASEQEIAYLNAVLDKLKGSRTGDKYTTPDVRAAGKEAFDQAAPAEASPNKLRPAIRVDGETRMVGDEGMTTHAQVADAQAEAFDAYMKNPKANIETGWVDSNGKWYDSQEAAVAADKSFLQLMKESWTETGSVGALTPEQLAKERQTRANRVELYNRISAAAKNSGKTIAKAATEDFGITPTMFRQIHHQNTIDQAALALGRLGDQMVQLNERAKRIGPEVDSIMEKGHLPENVQRGLRERAWGTKRPITYDNWISQKQKDINSHQLADAQKKVTEATRTIAEQGDKISAGEAMVMRRELDALVKDFNRHADQYAKIRSAYGRGMESMKHPPAPFPEDVMDRLRKMGHHIETVAKLKERIPIDSQIVETIGRVLHERTWKNLTDADQSLFLRNLVDSNRLNLFAPFSPILDITSNAVETGVQALSGIASDAVYAARNRRLSFPATQGIIRAIGLRRSGNNWPLEVIRRTSPEFEDAIGHTFGGEAIPGNRRMGQLVNSPRNWKEKGVFQTGEHGVFTRRANQYSAGYDTLKGTIMYGKSAVDTGFKRIAGYSTIWREALEAADKQGLKGVDRERFLDKYWADMPNSTLDQAVTDAKKAGWSRDLSHAEERFARSPFVKLFLDPFARWSFQFVRWGAEMLGHNPTLYRKMKAGTLGPEEFTRYMVRTVTGWGGVAAIDQWFNNNSEGYVDYQSGQWVEAATGKRQRISSLEPIMSALLLGQVAKAGAALAQGDHKAAEEHFSKAQGAVRFASVPFLRALYGDSGMLGGPMSQMVEGMKTGNWNRTRFLDEVVDSANRAIPGQSLLSAMETFIDPTLREGFGSKLPGVSLLKPERIDMTTGEPVVPRQEFLGVEVPAVGGTLLPGAKQIMQPISGLLSRYGLFEYRGPRQPIAGYRGSEAPEEINREWQVEFGKQRNLWLGQLLPTIRAAEMQIPIEKLTPQNQEYENLRKVIQKYDAIAARQATLIINSRHPAGRPLRRPTVREQRSASEVD